MRRVPKIGQQDEQRFIRQVDWNLFRQFYEIVQSGSVSGAARRLNTHQPSLSIALKRLEDRVGVTLCRRTARGIELTPAGKAVMQQSADMVEAIRMVPHLAAQAAKQIEGTLTIWMISDIISPELDEALASILRRHAGIELKIEIDTWRAVLDGVSSGECDLGVTYESESLPHLRYEPLIHETQQLYRAGGHTRSHWTPHKKSRRRCRPNASILSTADEPKSRSRAVPHALRPGKEHDGLRGRPGRSHAPDPVKRRHWFLADLAGILADQLWPILPQSLLPSYFIYLIAPSASRLSTPSQLFYDEMLRRLRAKPELS